MEGKRKENEIPIRSPCILVRTLMLVAELAVKIKETTDVLSQRGTAVSAAVRSLVIFPLYNASRRSLQVIVVR